MIVKKTYSIEDYYNTIKLLNMYNNNREVSRITSIPVSTVRNWKLGYCKPTRNKNRITPKAILKIKKKLQSGKTIPQICKELDLAYNPVLLLVKKNFPRYYRNLLEKRFHKLAESQRKINPKLAYILGVMFGDGYNYGRVKSHATALGVIDRDFRYFFAFNIENWSGKKPLIAEYIKRNTLFYVCILYSKDVGELILKYRNFKDVPPEIMTSKNEELKIMFIRGFVDSEGSVKKYWISVSNKNLKLLNSVRKMLVGLGFDEKRLRIALSNKNGVYNLDISTKNNMKLYKNKIGFSIKRKQERLEAAAGI